MDDKASAIEAIRQRADRARVPIYRVCEAAQISPANLTRWKGDPTKARWSTIGKLERVLDAIEAGVVARNTPSLHIEAL